MSELGLLQIKGCGELTAGAQADFLPSAFPHHLLPLGCDIACPDLRCRALVCGACCDRPRDNAHIDLCTFTITGFILLEIISGTIRDASVERQ